MFDYNLKPDEYKSLDLASLSQKEIDKLSYFLWCVYSHDNELMAWREKEIIPLTTPVATIAELLSEEV